MNFGLGAWLFAISVGASALGGALGMASGIFIVPILITFGGVGIHVAVADEAGAKSWATALRLHSSYPDRALGHEVPYLVRRVPRGLALMYGAGLISALLGIGSGALKMPAMDTALRLPVKVSSATSNFMIGVTAAASAAAYFARGDIDPTIAGPVALGSVVGAKLGARLLMVVSGERLRMLFVAVLVALAAQMLLSAFGVHLGGHAA
jgi:uncharacterized membrane protein YfcA